MQQVSRTKINTQEVSRTKSAREKFHEQNKFYVRKINMQEVSRKKISLKEIPGTKSTRKKFHEFSFVKRKFNVQVSRREKIKIQQVSLKKSAHNKFHEQKINTQQVNTISFPEAKNQPATSFRTGARFGVGIEGEIVLTVIG